MLSVSTSSEQGDSGLVARENEITLMRLGVVCEALTDQDGFALDNQYYG